MISKDTLLSPLISGDGARLWVLGARCAKTSWDPDSARIFAGFVCLGESRDVNGASFAEDLGYIRSGVGDLESTGLSLADNWDEVLECNSGGAIV